MNPIAFLIDRVYVKLNNEYQADLYPLDMLLVKLAMVVKTDISGKPLMVNNEVCNKRLRNYIVSQVNSYLLKFEECDAGESLKKVFSARQFKKLINSSKATKRELSGHVFIVIYHILRILATKTTPVNYDQVAGGYRNLFTQYLNNNPGDEIAQFALNCDNLISHRCNNGIVEIPPQDFPAIPRKNLDNLDE